jgi:RimJ/RimL family protein N-acetyltransferase
MRWFTEYVETHPDSVGWAAWYFLLKENDGGLTAVGNGGFKGVPDPAGTVEIGYSILQKHQGKGLAPEGVGALIDWAFSYQEVNRIIAQTLPDLRPSIRVLEKQGFTFVGDGLEHGTIMYQINREEHYK